MTIKIYGYGWVGKAMKTLFPDAVVHDPAQGMVCDEKCDVAFVCVPTPLKDGKLDTSIVEEVVRGARENFIIIRSTVMPGTCQKLWKETEKIIVFQPEYLGETANHPMTDQKARPFMILGGSFIGRRMAIEVYQKAYNANITIRQMSLLEAEIVKLTENRAIAFKVAQCQELYDVCERAGVDYYAIRDAVYGDDPRFNLWFTFVYPNARGFNSKCIPKDVYAWAVWAESVGYEPYLTKTMLKVNDLYLKTQ
jgi:UDPglucose 6-dehydrogenase